MSSSIFSRPRVIIYHSSVRRLTDRIAILRHDFLLAISGLVLGTVSPESQFLAPSLDDEYQPFLTLDWLQLQHTDNFTTTSVFRGSLLMVCSADV